MINTSTEFKQALSENGVCVSRASIILKNGTELSLNDANIMQGGVKIDDGVSSSGHFDIGSVIINKLTLNLNNMYDEFSDYDFTDALITVWTGKELAERTEWLKKGVFNADDPTATPSILTIEALDNMSKFDVSYDGKMSFPTTLQAIVQYCCNKCGVLLYNGQFPNYGYQISKNPFEEDNSNITYRALISYCALLAGCYARCNADGRLELKWYDTAAFEGIIDGGIFDQTTSTYYQTGDSLDGGNFTDYNSGNNADGGTFTENLPYHHIYSFSSLSVSTEDVVITGIRVKASDSEDSAGNKIEGETYLCGAEGYILEVSGNPLIEAGKAKAVADYLAGRIVGMRFRPFNASCIGDPSMEAGDAAIITDRKGNSYNTYLTNITYSTGNYANITCDAEPAARHSADRYSQIEQIVTEIKKDNQQKLSQYAQYVDQLNTLAINAMGYYETVEKQDDGSMIKYMHDKPLLSESKTVFKNSIDGFFWSHDGGKTWTMGVSKDGNAVMNVIAAIGLQADWINTGRFTAKDAKGVIKFLVDADTGLVEIRPDNFFVEGKTVTEIADGAAGKVSKELSASIELNEKSITAEVKRAQGQEVELAAAINLAQDLIQLKVSQGQVESLIAQNADSIRLKANKIAWASQYSSMTEDGKLNCTSGMFNGKIASVGNKSTTTIDEGQMETRYSDTVYTLYKAYGDSDGSGCAFMTYGAASGAWQRFYANNVQVMIAGWAKRGLFESSPTVYLPRGICVPNRAYVNQLYFQNDLQTKAHMSGNDTVIVCHTSLSAQGWLTATGTKSRIIDTENYGERLQYCYETPTPMFGDIGTAATDENGLCYVSIDDVFAETINTEVEYCVFLQKEGPGDIWVETKDTSFFVVKGTANLPFSWEVKAVQRDYEQLRLDDPHLVLRDTENLDNTDIEEMFSEELYSYDREMEELYNG